jgi:maltoporin
MFLLIIFSISIFSNDDKFQMGSYGRIGIASNLDGSSGKPTQIVSNSTRVEKLPYQELYLKYDFTSEESKKDNMNIKLNFTLAFNENLFHYTGQFKMDTAVRDFYIDVDNVFIKNLDIWVGSRMYRGDDIYLLDFWPLDNLNTVGFGLKYNLKNTELKFHLGANRLDQGDVQNPYQLLYYSIPLRDKIGSEKIIILDRQKYISSLGISQLFKNIKLKLKLYGEFHAISEASYEYEFNNYNLPSDIGYLFGFQTTYYGFNNNNNNYIHFFAKYSMNMAAYGELGIPYDLNNEHKTTGASELLFGLALNFEYGDLGLLLGSYFRNFKDADNNTYDDDDISEGILDVRFLYYIGKYFHLSTELSYQMLEVNNLDSISMKQETPQIFKFIFMPTISPNGRGNLTQPKIRLVYSLSIYNDSAQKIINHQNPSLSENPDSSWNNKTHYLGVSVEWWFNN